MNKLLIALTILSTSSFAATQQQIERCRVIDQMYNTTMVYADQFNVGSYMQAPIDQRKKMIVKVFDRATKMAVNENKYATPPYQNANNKWSDVRQGREWIPDNLNFGGLKRLEDKCAALFQ